MKSPIVGKINPTSGRTLANDQVRQQVPVRIVNGDGSGNGRQNQKQARRFLRPFGTAVSQRAGRAYPCFRVRRVAARLTYRDSFIYRIASGRVTIPSRSRFK